MSNQTETTVTLINPWSQVAVEKPISEILTGGLDRFCWPDEVTNALSGMVDTDEEWVVAAVKMMGAEQAGTIIIGG